MDILSRLPLDIIREEIIPFTYNPQPKEICDDIKSFYNVRKYLSNVYYNRWKFSFDYEEDADYNWLENDILRFYNNDVALMYGIQIDYTNKYKRLFMLNNKDEVYINKMISFYWEFEPKHMVNFLLGILTCEERNNLINFCEGLEHPALPDE